MCSNNLYFHNIFAFVNDRNTPDHTHLSIRYIQWIQKNTVPSPVAFTMNFCSSPNGRQLACCNTQMPTDKSRSTDLTLPMCTAEKGQSTCAWIRAKRFDWIASCRHSQTHRQAKRDGAILKDHCVIFSALRLGHVDSSIENLIFGM